MRRKFLIVLFLLVGSVLIASPWIKNQIIQFLSTHHKAEGLTSSQISENNGREAEFDFSAIHPPSFTDTLEASIHFDKRAIIGEITIESIRLKLPIVKGMTNTNLLVGAATMRQDQKMGEGNYPLAGHHMKQPNLLFGPLMNVEPGAIVKITDMNQDFIYKVISKQIIEERESGVIQDTEETQITLITCDKPSETSKRLVVKGSLVEKTAHGNK